MYAIGIDLGTTNSVAAVYRKGRKESVQIDGRYHLPSVVSFRKGQPPLVGHAAKARLLVDPESTLASTKRFMGERGKNYQIQGGSYSPVDVGAIVLRRLVEAARASLGQDVWDAVITVPAYFNEDQRADTRRAGEQAGLNVLRLLPEPSAAAISYGLNKNRDQTIMVYDLGGGTFDISILRVQGNDFKVLAVGGDSQLGGDDFDNAIVAWASQEFERRSGVNLLRDTGRENAVARQRLKEAAEAAKKELSEGDSAEILIPELAGRSFELELSIDQFDELTRPLLEKTIAGMHQVLRDTKMSADAIDRVILVGGSTRMRSVRRMVAREIKEPYSDESPDEAVAWGAAIVAASLSTPDEDLAPAIVVTEATAHTLGVGLLDRDHRFVLQSLVGRNSNYPCEAGYLGFTVDPFQPGVALRVFRGEREMAEDNHYLGQLLLRVKEPSPHQLPVALIFRLDQDGILHFKAVDLPLKRGCDPRLIHFIESAGNRAGAIDVPLLESLISGGVVPQPEEVSIDTR